MHKIMDDILIINTPTSGKILTDINEYHFKKAWKDNINKNRKNLYTGIAFFILESLLY
jgi:hypothetical protein